MILPGVQGKVFIRICVHAMSKNEHSLKEVQRDCGMAESCNLILDVNEVTGGGFSTKQKGNQKSNQLKSSVMYMLVKQVHPLLDNKLL